MFCFPFPIIVIIVVRGVFSFKNCKRLPFTLGILRQGGKGLLFLAQGFTWEHRCGTIYLVEDPAVVFSWILYQNPEGQEMKHLWYQGCIQQQHLSAFSQPPTGPAVGQCNSAFLQFHLHQQLTWAKSFQAWSTMGPAIVVEGIMGMVTIMGGREEYLGGENIGPGLGFMLLTCCWRMNCLTGGCGHSCARCPNCPQLKQMRGLWGPCPQSGVVVAAVAAAQALEVVWEAAVAGVVASTIVLCPVR